MRYLPACLAVLLATAAAPSLAATLTIAVHNVRDSKGTVHVDICPKRTFLKDDCPYSGDADAQVGTTLVTVTGLPPGRYAVQAFHDENDNGKVDRVLFGIPREGIGFSNNARIHLGPPKFADAVFDFDGTEKISLKMRYFLGRKGPKDSR